MEANSTLARLGLRRDELAGQAAVVTGAGRGIGRETALALSALGAAVAVAELDEASGAETAALVQAAGGEAFFMRTDVADEASVAELARRVLDQWGGASILVNNAILCPTQSLLEMDVATWDRTIAVNLRGAFLTCRAFLPAMLARGRGTIINMVSTDAMPYLSAYIASKRGIAGLSQSLAAEVGERGVQVVALAPGFVDTPALRAQAVALAPHLGMSAEQFMQLSFHPGYDRAMPAADAGAATAYLAARLAGDYHGEVIDGCTVLERAGFLRPAAAAVESAEAPAPAAHPAPAEALAWAHRLAEIVAETEAEFNRLPLFIRPLARSGFRNKAGQGTKEWAHTAAELAALLERLQAGDGAALAELQAGQARLARLLEQFAAYCQGVPAEAARFTRDQAFLQEAARIAAGRVAAVHALSEALQALAQA